MSKKITCISSTLYVIYKILQTHEF